MIIGENAQQKALIGTLNRICWRAKSQFTNQLEVKYYEPDPKIWAPGYCPFFYIAEVLKTRWLGIIPINRHKMLIYIDPWLYGESDKTEIRCNVYKHSLLDIVKEEIQKYADAFQAIAVVSIASDLA